MKQSKQSQPHNFSVYICGDCFSVPSNDPEYKFHWSLNLANKIKTVSTKIQVINLARPSPTNFGIALQIEKALTDPTTIFVIVNANEIFNVPVPTKKIDKINKQFWKHKGLIIEGHATTFKQPFIKYVKDNGFYIGADLLEKFTDYETDNTSSLSALNLYATIGVWALHQERRFREKGYIEGTRFTDQLWENIRNFFTDQFDINLQWNQDYALLEGKFYKLLTKKIDFVFNLGGLTDSTMISLGIDEKKLVPDELKPYYCNINFWNFPRLDLYQSPMFHIHNIKDHNTIANEYYNRFLNTFKGL